MKWFVPFQAAGWGQPRIVVLSVCGQRVHCARAESSQWNGIGSVQREVSLLLASALWRSFDRVDEVVTRDGRSVQENVAIFRDVMGKPELHVSGRKQAAVSFSYGPGIAWAASCRDGCNVGIDVAHQSEFAGNYPFHRVFGAEELREALAEVGENPSEGAALLWSAKEAVVKAVGCGFHLIDPLHVRMVPHGRSSHGIILRPRFAQKPLERFPYLAYSEIAVLSFQEESSWVSVAILRRTGEGAGLEISRARLARKLKYEG